MRIDGPQLTSSLSLNGTTITDLNVFVTTASFNGLTGSTATTGSNLFKGTQTISGSILPAVNNTYDLGSPTYQFRHVYISTGSLYIDGTKVLGSTSQELQITTDVGQSFKILETGSDSITLQSVDGNITLTNSGGGDVVLDPNTGVIQLKGPTTIYAGYKFLSSDGNAIHFGNGIAVTGSIVSTVTPLVSGSSQISYTGLSNVPSGIVSGSSQLTSSYDSRYVLSGSITQTTWDNIANKPVGITSGSSQIDITGTTGYSTFSSSISNSISSLSGSIATTTLGTKNRVDSIEAKTGSYATTGSNTFQGNQTITGSLYISANLVVQGSSSLQDVTGSNVYIGTNKINLNTSTPSIRFGGISVFDSGSNLGESGSLLWDSQLNHWVYQHPASSGAPYKSAMLISGPKNSGSLGDEIGLTTNVIQKAVGDDHIGDSIMTETGGGIGISGSLSVTGSIISTTTALVSGSNQIVYSGLTGIPSGIVSGSSQVIYSGLTGIPSGIISGSAQLPSGLVSGSSQILNGSGIWSGSAQLPSGIVSGSVQIVNLGFATTSSVITASSVRNVDTFTATANQSTFTTSQGYSVGLLDVFVNGSKLAASDYVALNGTSVLLNVAAEGGETVELYAYFQALNSNNALRTVTTATATASQTVFTGITYTQGLIEVYYNGSRLSASEYTATNGTSVTLSTAANVGDILDFIAYNYTVGAFVGLSGTGTANYLPKYASTSSLTNSSIIDNSGAVTINGTLVVTGTTLVSGSSQISYTGLSNIPSGIVSGSSQVTGYGFATTGSNIFQGNQTINGSMVITGSLTAQQYIVSSSVTYLTESFASGSHKFGDSSDDTHQFTGSLLLTGSLKVTGNASFGSSPQTYSGTAPYSALTFPRGEIMFSNTNTQNQLYIVSNAYLNSSGVFAYRSGSYNANSIAIDDGSISFSSATTGTTDGTITWLPALGISRNANVSISNSLSVTGSLTVGLNSISTTQLNVNTSSVSTQNVMGEFYNSDYTSGTRNFIRVRNAINSGGTMSSYFGQGQDGKTYIVSNDFTKNHIVIDGNSTYVGINKNTPNSQLDVNGNTTVSGSITMTTNTNAASPIYVSNTSAGTAAYSGIHIGNNRSANGGGVVLTSTGFTTANVVLSADSTYLYNNGTGGIGISSEQTGPIKFGTGGVLAMTISSTQQVAIGAQTPLSKLHVNTTSNTDGIYLYNNVSGNQQTLLLVGSSSVGSFIAGNTKPDGTAVQNGDFAGRIILQGGPTDGIQLQTSAVSAGVTHSWSTRLFVYHNGNVVMSGTGALTIPKGTTGERPTAVSGMVRFNTSVGLPEVYTGTDWIYMSALNGSSAETAAPSASVIKALNPAAPNGVYWLKFASGSNTAFQAYIIFDKPDGPWVKAVQWFNTTDLSGSAGVNAGGSWTSSQVGLSAGKIPSADINILKSSLTTLWRVTGSADSLMNYGAGALKIIWSYLPNWGTDAQPTTSQPYDIYVDAANDGTWDYGYRYVPTQQARCNHTTSIWVSDHDSPVGSGSTLLLGTKTSSADYPICWTVGATSWYTNLHPWTGNSAASAGSVQWGSASTAAALYFKN